MTHKVLKSKAPPNLEFAVAAHAVEMRQWRDHMKRVADDRKNGVPVAQAHMAYPRPAAHPVVEAAVNEECEPDFDIVDDGPTPAQVFAARKAELFVQVSIAEAAALAAVVPPGKRRLFVMRENDIRNADAGRAAALRSQNEESWNAAHARWSEAVTRRNDAQVRNSEAFGRWVDARARRTEALEKRAAAERSAKEEDGILAKVGETLGFKKKKVPAAIEIPEVPEAPEVLEIPEVPEVPTRMTDAALITGVEKQRPTDDSAHLQEQSDRRRRMIAIERAAARAHHDIEDLTPETIDAWVQPDFSQAE